MTEGFLFDIKRFAVHDGPGIRTTIFFKGCDLTCWWCHNPESRTESPHLSVRHLALEGRLFEKEEITGYIIRIEDILKEVEKDRIFYEESGGGITISGGEPLHQPDFCEELLKTLNKNAFHTALDTSGYATAEVIARMMPYTDLFLYDLKLMNDTEHEKYCGVSNRCILENIKLLVEAGKEIIIRFPLIPGVTDTETNVGSLLQFLDSIHYHEANAVSGTNQFCYRYQDSRFPSPEIHLLPYHNTGKEKYRRFRMDNLMKPDIRVDEEKLTTLRNKFTKAGFRVKIGG